MLAILLLVCLWQKPAYDDVSEAHKVAYSARQKQHEVPPTSKPIENPTTNYYTQYPFAQKESSPSEPSGWWLVGITAIYTIVSGLTLVFIIKQVNSIQRVDRAFLIPVWEDETWLNPNHHNGEPLDCSFRWRFKNCGKTPAFIREAWGNIVLIESISDLPKAPIYGEGWKFEGDPLIQDKVIEDGPFVIQLNDKRPIEQIKEDYRVRGKVLFAYGFVKYDDMFGRKHETRFGCRLMVSPYSQREDRFVIGGPDRYNKYT